MVKVNLLPVRASAQKELMIIQLTIAVIMLLVALAAIGAFHFSLSGKIDSTSASIAKVNAELVKLKKIEAKVTEFKKNMTALEKKLDVINDLSLSRVDAVYLMDALVEVTPQNLWIESLKEVKRQYLITGISLDYETIASFMTNMENSPFFSEVKLKSTKQKKIGGQSVHNFTVQTRYKVPQAEGK